MKGNPKAKKVQCVSGQVFGVISKTKKGSKSVGGKSRV